MFVIYGGRKDDKEKFGSFKESKKVYQRLLEVGTEYGNINFIYSPVFIQINWKILLNIDLNMTSVINYLLAQILKSELNRYFEIYSHNVCTFFDKMCILYII